MKKTAEKITLRFKIHFSISKLENAPEPIPVPNPIAKKRSTSRKNSYPGIHFSKKSKKIHPMDAQLQRRIKNRHGQMGTMKPMSKAPEATRRRWQMPR